MMDQETPYLSVIIPAYNEEQRIAATLAAIYTYLKTQPYSWEMLVANDGSHDATMEVVRRFAADKPQVRWNDRRDNHGKGYTVREGMLLANGRIRLFTDADNSTDMRHFDQMIPLFERGSDVVICSRDPKDAPGAAQAVPQPFVKRLLGNLGNLFIQFMAVPGIWDTQCGFKAFTAEAACSIFQAARVDGWAFDIEALALARRFGYKTAVIPANWVDDSDTHVTFRNYLEVLADTVRIRWHLWQGAYRKPAVADGPPPQLRRPTAEPPPVGADDRS